MRARELRILCYKSWLETRGGFLLALAILLVFSLWSVLRYPAALSSGLRDMQMHGRPNAALRGIATYIHIEIFEKLTLLWAMLSVMLGTGGLLKERLLGTAPFLLSLPAGRRRLLAARSTVTILEAVGLALAAYAIVPLALPLVRQSYSLALALRFATILAAAGMSFVAYGILISAVLEGTHWPGIIGATTAFLALLVGEAISPLRGYSPFALLSGDAYFQSGAMPWTGMATSLLLAAFLLSLALWLVEWQDF